MLILKRKRNRERTHCNNNVSSTVIKLWKTEENGKKDTPSKTTEQWGKSLSNCVWMWTRHRIEKRERVM